LAEDLELEELKRRKLLELQRKLEEERKIAEAKEKYEAEKQSILRVILTPDARQRLSNLKMVRPDFVENLENDLIQAVQSGRIEPPITDEMLKRILIKLQGFQKREIKIRRI